MKTGGALVWFLTHRNARMQPLVQAWRRSNSDRSVELRSAFAEAGFGDVAFSKFPGLYRYLDLWGYIVVATRGGAGAPRNAPA